MFLANRFGEIQLNIANFGRSAIYSFDIIFAFKILKFKKIGFWIFLWKIERTNYSIALSIRARDYFEMFVCQTGKDVLVRAEEFADADFSYTFFRVGKYRNVDFLEIWKLRFFGNLEIEITWKSRNWDFLKSRDSDFLEIGKFRFFGNLEIVIFWKSRNWDYLEISKLRFFEISKFRFFGNLEI